MSGTNIELKKFQLQLRKHVDAQMSKWSSFVYAQKNGFYQGFEILIKRYIFSEFIFPNECLFQS